MREIDISAELESIVAQEFKYLHSGGGRSSRPLVSETGTF
jgi:hypothetical protein